MLYNSIRLNDFGGEKMAQVTAIRENRGLIRIDLDGVRWISVRKKHFSRLPLEEGGAVEPEQYLDALAEVQAADCYEAALTILDSAAQTRAGMEKKLVMKGYAAPAAKRAVQRLADAGLIDDRRFAERAAQTQLNKPVGAYAVRRKLRAKNLTEDDIEAVMADFDEAQQTAACRDAARRLWRKYSSLEPREGTAKLTQALARRGFSWDTISECVEEIRSEADDPGDI